MSKTRNPNGTGTFCKLKDGRYKWSQMIDGEERQLTARSPKELQEKIKKVSDLPIVKNKLKVSDWFEKWLDVYVKPLLKTATYDQYRVLYEQHINPAIGKRKLSSIKQVDIQNIVAEMSQKTKSKRVKNKETGKIEKVDTGEKLSTWTMKHTRKVLNLAFEKAFEDKLIAENPVRGIKLPKRQAKPRKTINTKELKILFDHTKNTRWHWAFKFMLVTGLRRGELLALRWSDIDFENKKIIVDESDSVGGLGDTKSAEIHYVPLSSLAMQYLVKQKEMLLMETNPILHNEELKKTELIFPSKAGTMMKPDSLNSVLDRINKKAGINITPHMFRHTFVYRSKGLLSLPELQEALGHDESTTTLDIYGTMLSDTGSVADKIDQAFKKLDEELGKIEKVGREEEFKVINLFPRRKIE